MFIDWHNTNIQISLISILGTLGGVIIGGVLTTVSTVLIDHLKSNRDEKIYKIRKKEETYLELIKLLGSYEVFGEDATNIDRELMLGTLSKTRLHNSEKVQGLLTKIVDNDDYWKNGRLNTTNEELQNIIKNMLKTMRIELKIEDK